MGNITVNISDELHAWYKEHKEYNMAAIARNALLTERRIHNKIHDKVK